MSKIGITGMPRCSAVLISMRTMSLGSSRRRLPCSSEMSSHLGPITASRTSQLAISALNRSMKSIQAECLDIHENATGAKLQRHAVGEVPRFSSYPSDDSSEIFSASATPGEGFNHPTAIPAGRLSDEGLEAGGIGGRCLARCLPALTSEFY